MLSLWTWFRFEKKSAKFRLGKLSCHCRLNCHHLLFQNERPTWRLVEQVLPLPSDPGPGSHLPMPAWKFLFKKKILKNELEDSKTTRWAIKKSKALTSFPPPPPASTAPGCHPSWVTISPLQVDTGITSYFKNERPSWITIASTQQPPWSHPETIFFKEFSKISSANFGCGFHLETDLLWQRSEKMKWRHRS